MDRILGCWDNVILQHETRIRWSDGSNERTNRWKIKTSLGRDQLDFHIGTVLSSLQRHIKGYRESEY